MSIEAGARVPNVDVQVMGAEGRPETVSTESILGSGRVVLFAVPGAFTPGCSKTHLPGYVQGADELKAHGVDRIVCTAVNDAWVMDAWARDQGAGDKITMLADGSGFFAKAMGLEFDRTPNGMGVRSMRYSALIEDGVIKALDVDASGAIESSSCETMLKHV